MKATLRLPYEDEASGLRERVYEKDVDVAAVPVAGQLGPATGHVSDTEGRVVERVAYPSGGGCLVWLSPVSGYSHLAFARRLAIDRRLEANGWRRVYHQASPDR
jgi:hypothetical protein